MGLRLELAKRVSSPEKLETAMKSEITARSAESRTDSEVAFSPSAKILSTAHATRLDIRPIASSRTRLRIDSTSDRTSGSAAQRYAVRSLTPFCSAHSATGDAVGDGNGEHHFLTVGGFSGHEETTRWRFVTEAPVRPDARFSARGSGWPARPRGVRKQWNACSGRSRCSEAKRRQMSVDVSFQKGSRVARAAIVNEFF